MVDAAVGEEVVFRPYLLYGYMLATAPVICLLLTKIYRAIGFSRTSKALEQVLLAAREDAVVLARAIGDIPLAAPEAGLRAGVSNGRCVSGDFGYLQRLATPHFECKVKRLKLANEVCMMLWHASVIVAAMDSVRLTSLLLEAFSLSKVNPFWLTALAVSRCLDGAIPWFVYLFVVYVASRSGAILVVAREAKWEFYKQKFAEGTTRLAQS